MTKKQSKKHSRRPIRRSGHVARSSPKPRKRVKKQRPQPDRAPRTAKQYFTKSRAFQETWDRVVQVPGLMRSRKLSLSRASEELRLSPKVVLRLAGLALRKRTNGTYVAKKSDRLLRVLAVPSKKGLREVVIRDSRDASVIGAYWSAVQTYLSTGDSTALQRMSKRRIRDAYGKRIRLVTDIDELSLLANAGVLSFESIYARLT
jgi:hypothetical protein